MHSVLRSKRKKVSIKNRIFVNCMGKFLRDFFKVLRENTVNGLLTKVTNYFLGESLILNGGFPLKLKLTFKKVVNDIDGVIHVQYLYGSKSPITAYLEC